MDIPITNRHRAFGDAEATVRLFSKVLAADKEGCIKAMLNGKNKHQYLPPHLPLADVDGLPQKPGVYYFHNEKGKVIYVGKARSLQQRVKSHFSNNDAGKRKQEFLRTIYRISYQVCGSELSALILESAEIRRLWPEHNRSQKRFQHTYGLYSFEDQNGYLRLAIEKKRKHLQPIYSFNLLQQGYILLRKLVTEFMLDEGLCFFDKTKRGVEEDPVSYNNRVNAALNALGGQLPSFAVVESGKSESEHCYILIEQGRFYGMGYLPGSYSCTSIHDLKSSLTQYPDNDYVRHLIYQYADRHPHRKRVFE
jgi:DNA polymerase-3 subunit epsilon